ncbi:MAG: type II toxin-antitoxin system RelE/ParE family toxin [Fimbriimonadaceae bacterium]|nr:type II toxin-antitoxin system RelE/ParE family toxin [Fimbriimonadaceae bacterium]MBX3121210.1 type II toxin-antitoxin system RelE/ParE family toxin [Fimbriimonadaceae bacterium]
MIKTFADRRTQELYATGNAKRFPTDVAKRAARKLEYVDLATRLDDLKVSPGNRLHALEGDRRDNIRSRSMTGGASASGLWPATPMMSKFVITTE